MTEGRAGGVADAARDAASAAAPRPARAAAPSPAPTSAAVRRYAPHLGLDPDRVPLRVADADQGGPLGGARGSASAQEITLRPSALRSGDVGLLVHELAHLAQHRNRERPPSATFGTARPDITAAESEAAALAVAARTGAPLWRPRAVLPCAHTARDTGAVGVAPRRPPRTPDPEAAAQLGIDTGLLELLVADNHIDEITRIRNELHGFWEVDQTRRDAALRVIEPLRFVVARSVIKALRPDERRKLARLSDDDHADHPRAAIAVLAALDGDDVDALGDALTSGRHSALHGVDPAGLDPARPAPGGTTPAGPVVLRAFFDVLYLLKEEQLVQLLKTDDKGPAFRDLLRYGPPAGSEREEVTAALAEERRAEQARKESVGFDTKTGGKTVHTDGVDEQLVRSVEEILTAHHNADAARAALKALEPLSDKVPAGRPAGIPGQPTSPPAAGSAAPAVPAASAAVPTPKNAGNAPVEPGERLRAIVRELDRRGLVDVILDHLPSENRYVTAKEGSEYGAVLSSVLRARSPGLTLPRIEDLLSYGLFDWEVTDDDARFAYLLVRSLPLAVQDEWRRRDDSKWFHRLEGNIPEDMVIGGEYTGVGSEYTLDGDKAVDEEVKSKLQKVLADWRSEKNDKKDDKKAQEIIEGLAPEDAKTAALRTAVVRRLDTLGVVDEMVSALEDEYIVGEAGRHVLDRLFALRDPVRLLWHASHTTWYVTSARKAWLAYLMLRSLPGVEQKRWDREHPGMWLAMQFAMTPQMRQSAALGALTGRTGTTMADLRERICDPELWDGKHTPELWALILLAYAADGHAWVFGFSQGHAGLPAMRDPEFVAGLGLYDASSRPEYHAEELHVPSVWEEIGHYAAAGVRTTVYLVGAALQVLPEFFKNTMHLSVDFQALQGLGGDDVLGAQFTDRSKSVVGGTTAADRELRARTNTLDLWLDPGRRAFRMEMPQLRLNRLNIVRPGASYRTGSVTLRGFKAKGSFAGDHFREPVGFAFDMAQADVRDLVIAVADRGAAALARIVLDTLAFTGGATGTEDLDAAAPRPGSIPVPVFGPLLRAIDNMVMLWGGIPGDLTPVDLMLLPLDSSGLPWVLRKIIGAGSNYLANAPAPGDYVYGLASDGALRPPRSVAARMADALKMLRSLQLSLDSLEITGASFGAGTQIASIKLHDLAIGVGLSRPAYLRALISSLDRRIEKLAPDATATLVEQRAKAQVELGGLAKAEQDMEDLERRDRQIPGSLSADERKELARLNTLLRSDIGVTLDVGGIEIGRVSGAVETAGATIGAVHLAARLPDRAWPEQSGGYLDDRDLAHRFLEGPRKPATGAEMAETGDAEFSVAGVKVVPGPDGGPALRFPAGRIPRLAVLEQYYADLPPQATVLRAQMIRVLAARRDLAVLEGQPPKEPSAEYDRQLHATQRLVRRLLGWEVGSLSVGAIGGTLDKKGTFGVQVTGVEAQDVVGAKFAVRKVTGDVSVGMDPGRLGDLSTLTFKEGVNTVEPKLRADLHLDEVQTSTGVAGSAALQGLTGTVELIPDGVRIDDLGVDKLTLETLDLSTDKSSIVGEQVTVEHVTADVSYTSTTGPDGVEVTRLNVPTLHIGSISGTHVKYKSEDEKSRLEAELLHGKLGDITGSGLFYVSVGDTKSLMGGDIAAHTVDLHYEIVKTLFQGKGKPQTKVTGAVVGTAGAESALSVGFAVGKDGKKTTFSSIVDADLVAVDTTFSTPDLSVTVKRMPLKAHAKITDTGVEGSLTLTNVDIGAVAWHSGTASVKSPGGTKLDSVTIRAAYTFGDPRGGDEAALPPVLKISQFDVAGIDAADFRYQDTDPKSPIDLRLGRKEAHPGALHVDSVKLTGIELPFTAHGDLISAKTAFHADITGFHVDAHAVLGALKAAGQVEAATIAVGFSEGGGRITARGKGVHGDVDLDYDASRAPGGLPKGSKPLTAKAHAAFDRVDTGDITVTHDAIVVDGFSLPKLAISKLDVVARKTGDSIRARTEGKGAVRLLDTTATVRVDRHTGVITFQRLRVSRLEAAEVRADVDGFGVFYAPPPGTAAGTGIAVLENISADGLQLDAAGKIGGQVTIDKTTVPMLRAEIGTTFQGDVFLGAGKITIDVAANALKKVVVDHPHGRILGTATVSETKSLMLGDLGADSLTYTPGTGPGGAEDFTLEVVNGTVSDLVYDDHAGLKVTVKSGKLPGSTKVHDRYIPRLELTDADIDVDFTGGRSRDSDDTADLPPSVKDPLMNLLDSLEGHVPLDIVLRAVSLDRPRDIEMKIDLRVTGGVVDFDDVLRQAEGSLTFTPTIPGARVAAALYLRWDLSGNVAALQLHGNVPVPGTNVWIPVSMDIYWWTLKDPKDVARFKDSHQMRLQAAIKDRKKDSKGGGPAAIDVTIGPGAQLDIKNPEPVPVTFTGDPSGHILLSKNVATGIGLEGSLRAMGPEEGPEAKKRGELTKITLAHFGVDEIAMAFAGGPTVTTKKIEVSGVHDGTMVLSGTHLENLHLNVTKGVANDIKWTKP